MRKTNVIIHSIRSACMFFERELLYLVDNSLNFSDQSTLFETFRATITLAMVSAILMFLEHIPCCCVVAELLVLTLVLRLCSSSSCESQPSLNSGRIHLILSVVTGFIVCMIYRFFVVPFQHFHMMSTTFFLMMSMGYVACWIRLLNTFWHFCSQRRTI